MAELSRVFLLLDYALEMLISLSKHLFEVNLLSGLCQDRLASLDCTVADDAAGERYTSDANHV